MLEASRYVANLCGYVDAVAATQADACYPHDLVPLACASASSNPSPHDCVYIAPIYYCDYTVTAGGGGSGLLSAGDVFVSAFDWEDTCHWISAGGSCSVDNYQYELPMQIWATEACSTTNTATIVTLAGAARATAKGDCVN